MRRILDQTVWRRDSLRYTGDDMSAVSSPARLAMHARLGEEESPEEEQETAVGKTKESVVDIGVPLLQQPSLAEDAVLKAMTDERERRPFQSF